MAALTGSNAAMLQIEGLNSIIPEVLERTNTLDAILGDGGQSHKVSTKAFRVRLQTSLPGAVAQVNLDSSSAFPTGAASTWDQGTVTPVSYMLPVAYSKLADLTGDGKDIATLNPVVKTIEDIAKQVKTWRDIFLQTGGDGVLGTVDSTSGSTITLRSTVTTTIDGRGARLCKKGQLIQVMSSAFALRGTATIANVSQSLGGSQQIVVDAIPGSTVAGDVIVVAGVAAGTPAFINGIPYWHSTATSGSKMGISNSNPYVVANGVNLSNAAQVTLPVFRTAINQIKNRLGGEAVKGQFFHTHFSQTQAYEELGFAMQTFPMNGGAGQKFDLLFTGKKSIADLPVHENVHADQTRWDILLKEAYGKVKFGTGTFWYKNRDGQMVFNVYDPTTGNPTAIESMYMVDAWQLFCQNPIALGSVTGAKVPVNN